LKVVHVQYAHARDLVAAILNVARNGDVDQQQRSAVA
jgi:hypothetical protein